MFIFYLLQSKIEHYEILFKWKISQIGWQKLKIIANFFWLTGNSIDIIVQKNEQFKVLLNLRRIEQNLYWISMGNLNWKLENTKLLLYSEI